MGKSYVQFDHRAYNQAVRKAIELALYKVSIQVHREIRRTLAGLKVRRLDEQYKSSILGIAESLRVATKKTTSSVMANFGVGEATPNQSFRAVYYEYGTGTKMQPPKGFVPGGELWNPARPRAIGAKIYNRPYGVWEDMGGNPHISKFKGKPRPLDPKKPLGEEVEPQRWFKEGFIAGTKDLDRLILEAVKSVPLTAYIKVKGIHKKMG